MGWHYGQASTCKQQHPIWVSIYVPAAPLTSSFSATGQAVEDGPKSQNPAPTWETRKILLAPGFILTQLCCCSHLRSKPVVRRALFLCLSFSHKYPFPVKMDKSLRKKILNLSIHKYGISLQLVLLWYLSLKSHKFLSSDSVFIAQYLMY